MLHPDSILFLLHPFFTMNHRFLLLPTHPFDLCECVCVCLPVQTNDLSCLIIYYFVPPLFPASSTSLSSPFPSFCSAISGRSHFRFHSNPDWIEREALQLKAKGHNGQVLYPLIVYVIWGSENKFPLFVSLSLCSLSLQPCPLLLVLSIVPRESLR